METVKEYLSARGIGLPELKRDDWAHIPADSPVGKDLTQLWLEANLLWSSCDDVRDDLRNSMIPHLVMQCEIWYFG